MSFTYVLVYHIVSAFQFQQARFGVNLLTKLKASSDLGQASFDFVGYKNDRLIYLFYFKCISFKLISYG